MTSSANQAVTFNQSVTCREIQSVTSINQAVASKVVVLVVVVVVVGVVVVVVVIVVVVVVVVCL